MAKETVGTKERARESDLSKKERERKMPLVTTSTGKKIFHPLRMKITLSLSVRNNN